MTKAEKYLEEYKRDGEDGDVLIHSEPLETALEISRIEGILLGLELAKKAWDKGLGREDIVENERIYRSELESYTAWRKPE